MSLTISASFPKWWTEPSDVCSLRFSKIWMLTQYVQCRVRSYTAHRMVFSKNLEMTTLWPPAAAKLKAMIKCLAPLGRLSSPDHVHLQPRPQNSPSRKDAPVRSRRRLYKPRATSLSLDLQYTPLPLSFQNCKKHQYESTVSFFSKQWHSGSMSGLLPAKHSPLYT
jgi:hypothetical protein